ncbi:MAG: 30S ribosomal protein S8 [Planctomycetota bacterium]|jgi:small subunit ribosomal protein S8
MMTDPIADQLTRIRNALAIRREFVDVPHSSMKQGLADVLVREGFILGHKVIDTKPRATLRILLKYGPDGEDVITQLQRTSKPGKRFYTGVSDLKPVQQGQGIAIISTSKGILSDRECLRERIGGEVLATVW